MNTLTRRALDMQAPPYQGDVFFIRVGVEKRKQRDRRPSGSAGKEPPTLPSWEPSRNALNQLIRTIQKTFYSIF